jgi:excisionase family DNA binding protein
VDAAAEYTSLSKDAIRTAAKRGKLESHKGPSGRLVFRANDLDDFMRSPE